MKATVLISLFLLATPLLARAELRSIAVRVTRAQDTQLRVSIYSEEKSEDKREVSVAEAKVILVKAKSWGSAVWVVVVPDPGVRLAEYLPILEAISQNAFLDLIALKSRDNADMILKHYNLTGDQPSTSK